jgi:TPP-dependent pyruvate/acetoin dehydrogenase alpha subunit
MKSAGLLHPDDLTAIEKRVAAEVNDAVAFAEAGQWEPIEMLTKDVYAGAKP